MKTPRQALGAWGEDLAAAYLERRGYAILERNAQKPVWDPTDRPVPER
jgi:hypothetical protein